jgi:hypothetical protein
MLNIKQLIYKFQFGQRSRNYMNLAFPRWTVCIEKYLQEELEQQIEGFEMATFIEDLGKREHLLEEITEDVRIMRMR